MASNHVALHPTLFATRVCACATSTHGKLPPAMPRSWPDLCSPTPDPPPPCITLPTHNPYPVHHFHPPSYTPAPFPASPPPLLPPCPVAGRREAQSCGG